jgi:lambda repressor-like predicted transcriptional regulator
VILKPLKLKYDEWAIRAELGRRGLTFKAMAAESGIDPKAFSAAFVKPSTKVNRFIAKSLGICAHELWPDWFDADDELIPARYRRKLNRLRRQDASPESRVA